MKLTWPNDRTPELPTKMYMPATTTSLIRASVTVRWKAGAPNDAAAQATIRMTASIAAVARRPCGPSACGARMS